MTELVRTKASVFDIENSMTLSKIEEKVLKDGKNSVLQPPDTVFTEYEKLNVTEVVTNRLLNGALSRSDNAVGTYRAYAPDGRFVGIAEVFQGEKGNVIKIVKAFTDR